MQKLLGNEFLESYRNRSLPFGNDLSYLVYARTYSRKKSDGSNEDWTDTIARVVEGCYDMQRTHIEKYHLGWDNEKAIDSAKEMFDRMWNMKFLPPGRGLWAMGTELTNGDAPLYAALNNCAFISTDKLGTSFEETVKPFLFLMDLSMLGVGVGFDVNGANKVKVYAPAKLSEQARKTYEFYTTEGARYFGLNFVQDSREGWVESVRQLLTSYFIENVDEVLFRYDDVRPKGTLIKKFGGVASGPAPLIKLHEQIREILDKRACSDDNLLSVRDIVDIMNLIGVCVVSGNVRRSAEIVFGSPYDDEYLKLKDYKFVDGEVIGSAADRIGFGWASNNSVFADLGMDYTKIADQIALNGEPGLAWLENMQNYSRMGEKPDYKDHRVAGGNPCVIGSSLIAVADGRNAVKIEDLVGTTYPVYSRDFDGKITIKQSIKTWKTRENAEVWKLTLDDGSILQATPDHEIMLRDGSYKQLRDLVVGESLMPFNSRGEVGDYRKILDAYGTFWFRHQHRMIYEHQNGLTDGKAFHVHHKDEDKNNDSLDNLELLPSSVHRGNHASTGSMYGKKHSTETLARIGKQSERVWQEHGDKISAAIKAGMADPAVREKISAAMTKPRVEYTCPVCQKSIEITEFKAEHDYKSGKKACSNACANSLRDRSKYKNRVKIEFVCSVCQDSKMLTKGSYDRRVGKYHTCGVKCTRIKQKMIANGTWNHKVVSVEFSHYEDVYDMTVEDTHNFAVITSSQDKTFINSSGIFISNCLEQSLESAEVCCLVETFLPRHETIEDYVRTLKFAYLYAKTVTLGQTHWIDTNRVMLRNRRIGTSQSGIAQFIEKHGLDTYKDWCYRGYDAIQHYDNVYSDWFCVRNSIKTTSIKPSGTVSLLPNVTPGMHWPTAKYYIRRIRIADDSPLIEQCRQANLHIEADKYAANTMVVSLPCKIDINRTIDDVSMLEQMEMAAVIQEVWADNQVSCTVTFDPKTEGHLIAQALTDYQYRLKGISFLPKLDESNAYEQAPYEKIAKDEYDRLIASVTPISRTLTNLNTDGQVELFCDGDTCIIK